MTASLRRFHIPLLALAIFAFAMWQYVSAIDNRDFHRDEARWIHRGEYLRELRHPLGPYWDEATWRDGASLDERNRLRAQPPMGSYLMGLGFVLQGEPLPDIGYWNMDHDTPWNAERGNMPSDDMLTTARRTTATLAALTVVAVFLIGTRLTAMLGAVIGALYLAVHPLARYLATFAGSDAALAFFIAFATLAAARLAEKPTWPRAVLLGILLGLGGSTKLSPLAMAAALAGLGVILLALHRATPHRVGWMLVSAPIVAAITFVVSYPYLWRSPISHSLNVLRYRTQGMDVQGSMWQQVAVPTPWNALERIWNRFTGQEWSVAGRFFSEGFPLEMLLGLAGLIILALLAFRRGLTSQTMLVLVCVGSILTITVLGMKVDWARYHYPILIGLSVGVSVSVGQLQRLVTKSGWRATPYGPDVPT